jgi:hypothetical protein
MRSPSVPPTLRIQTRQTEPAHAGLSSEFVSDPSSLGSAPERRPLQVVSPPPAGLQPVPLPSAAAYPGPPQHNPTTASPAPQNPSDDVVSTASQFPPRKSSIGQNDRPNLTDASGSAAGSNPESASDAKPRAQQRSEPPSQPSGQPNGTSTKPLPFVRPADIYRRMEEEKEKERRSMDSSRPSIDSAAGAGSDRSASPARSSNTPADQRRRMSFDREEGADPSRGARPMLASVAERKSEYGLEHLIGGSAPPRENALPNPLGSAAGASQQAPEQGAVSPQLPAVARMSGFGEDLFSSQKQHDGGQPAGQTQTPITSIEKLPSPVPNPARSTSPSKNAQGTLRPPRPSIPGGWVSETTNVWSDNETPLATPDERPILATAGDVSPLSDSDPEPESVRPTATTQQGPSLEHEGIAQEAISSTDRDIPAAKRLPPLQTANPLGTPTQARPVEAPYQDSPSNYSATTQQTGSTISHFTPTAPLNPHRSDLSASESTQAGEIPRNLTLSSSDSASPANESDKLRQDIINSLSPVNASGGSGLLASVGSDTSRESTYLSGVYDEYLGLGEEKPRHPTDQRTGDATNSGPYRAPPIQTSTEQRQESTPEAVYSSVEKTPKAKPPKVLTKRFSWEQGPEEVNLSPTVEEETGSIGSSPTGNETKASEHASSAPLIAALQAGPVSSDSTSPRASPAGSHVPALEPVGLEPPSPVSATSEQKSSLPSDAPAQIPSPSPMSQPALAPVGEASHLSLAEEKGLVQASSHPVSPSPPRDDHPALSRPPAESPSPISATPSLHVQQQQQYNLIAWREIIGLATSDQRVEKFEEARAQFQAMESGLSNWLLQMSSQHEHTSIPEGTGGAQQSPTGMQQSQYQQYASRSNSNLPATSPGTGRAPTGHPQSSGFGASTSRAQVGAKSKELLHTAGALGNKATKSGMKLFNKGKNKLRGTGDKVFS